MKKKILINEVCKLFYFFQIDVNAYKIVIFNNNKWEFDFKVALQPIGVTEEFPTYQLMPRSQKIPHSLEVALPLLSDWISEKNNLN